MYRCERVLSNYVQMWKSTFKLYIWEGVGTQNI
jgi:hypothetical protein